ncbi:MAG: hypothetical protein KF850_11450 [Labilithrix sp.]|nr:hypothetical protein [Labilithrix sp.]MBX3212640.1 hypothetical protein [Labilithrix sp.]
MGRVYLVLVLVLGCSTARSEPTSTVATGAATASAAREGAVDAAGLRCRALPAVPDDAARSRDCSAPHNSDGTPKRSAPAPASERGTTVLFHLEDFGPPSMQLGVLGDAWWSWERGGSWEPCDQFDIRVVVHRGALDDATRARFATVRGRSDYRYIERGAATRYLDARIAELAEPAEAGADDLGSLRRRLELTRRTIDECVPR